ncbi:MAG: TraR/DksA C4-type zinc finger protein [Candidatus Omnitrophica bacterium]|nr:TraR/DksA C4-type zinc finger protein [Candidatus Omnitrophota bacterium]MBU2044136.1 TraR/DksA C4-type zinc finger protein [Candidatus Omnitrophota bacterium]MBU2250636.1 TraR/DksA C4-type zinc finger protein [Candidatus Omnitrophota bacterium]MBU2265809.1 TraR/DksA C4-type zinc finger protein [Candidatus Omnitrophota bacterium]MBU2473853.1 TraR/DksA C4-type zinc finger protein [Candidatus Omnitrophota bacterium]
MGNKKQPMKKSKKVFSKKDLDGYREKLLNLKDDFVKQMKEISEDTLMKTQKDMSGDISGYGLHIADVASDNYERDFNLSLVSNERKVVMEIDEALKRIDENIYGICQVCIKPVAKTRLKAIPYAKHCKKCQEKIENQRTI